MLINKTDIFANKNKVKAALNVLIYEWNGCFDPNNFIKLKKFAEIAEWINQNINKTNQILENLTEIEPWNGVGLKVEQL